MVKQCDQDTYAAGGQKCSKESVLLLHSNLKETNFLTSLQELASKRNVENGTIVPLLSITNEEIKTHIKNILEKVPGSRVLFGGEAVKSKFEVPEKYGLFQPTAVFIPIDQLLNRKNWQLIN